MHKNQNKTIYSLLSWTQYIAAILVIMIHCDQIFASRACHFAFKTVICRLAVPIFLLTSGYFFRLKTKQDNSYSKIWFKKQIKSYLFWSVFFIPFGFLFLKNNMHLSVIMYFPALIVGFFYLGTYYHLWYFPALLIGMFLVNFFLQKFGQKITLLIMAILYSFGLLETYSEYLTQTKIASFYSLYQKFFFTPRNGFFYAGLFILLGFFLADQKEYRFWQEGKYWKLGLSLCCYLIEAALIYRCQGIDKNFMVMLPLVAVFLFNILIKFNSSKFAFRNIKLKQYTMYYFFLHPISLEIVKYFLPQLAKNSLFSAGIIKLILTLLLTHLLSGLIIYRKNWVVLQRLKICSCFLFQR